MKTLTIHRPAAPEPADLCWGVEGEIALPTQPCAGTNPDCGCDRSLIGLNSHAASTTVRVTESELTFEDLVTAVAGYYENAWGATPHEAADLAAAVVGEATDVATYHRAGTVLRPWFDDAAQEWRYRIASGVL
ncbi:DUF7715 family protein [Mycobacterium sp. 94-17]|uniref:DUF7715 family protein n=1 Tax=Mycobacterium sp. 94-17 TaxID=2986147 RepID=UPI002D1F7048|nr:hypothetical protein [Mycobacterium sp. 94-17]MEB4208748.1 hypothetical protein [Mycobacterium sp. 94-17]